MLRFVQSCYHRLFKRKVRVEKNWLSYYSKDKQTIEFTDKTIYNYLKSSVGNDLHYYALNYFGTRITYKELFKKIDLASRSLKYLGVKQKDIVTICMPNTPEAVICFYAINKIGAVADMVHPLSAPNEVKRILKESNSRIMMLYDANYEKYKSIIEETNIYKTILTSVKESMPVRLQVGYDLTRGFKIPKPSLKDLDYISWREFLDLGHLYKKEIRNTMDYLDLAVILHSGGTTGVPKGIMLSNFNFNAETQQDGVNVYDVRPTDKIMTILPIFHGFGLAVCLNCPLTLKVETILVPEFDSKSFPKMIEKYKPNVIAGVPTLWEAMMSNPKFENIDLSFLKYIISGGDHMSIQMEKDMNNFLHKHGASINISKGYGMTESVAATAYTFNGTNELGSIGIPMIGNDFCICSPDSTKVLPKGEEGEICVNGPTVMMGYYNNDEETKKVLLKHEDGKIWLHTGDAGYISKEGIIYFTQRLKRVIVSSGFNVYPNAIEEVIMNHPKVKSCAVIGVPHPYKMQVPKVYIVLKDNQKVNAIVKAEIRLLCKKNLAGYAQPKEFVFRENLPKTLYNKIDYKELEKENYKR